jgi:hypothetical protein
VKWLRIWKQKQLAKLTGRPVLELFCVNFSCDCEASDLLKAQKIRAFSLIHLRAARKCEIAKKPVSSSLRSKS